MVSAFVADTWRATASEHAMRARAKLYSQLRNFFAARDILEVETPILGQYTVTEPSINSLQLREEGRYCQTSPEYAMKRLLAAGLGAIYQMSKVFRAGEKGRLHNPEFSLLEWYRPEFTMQQLMAEVAAMVAEVTSVRQVVVYQYREIFLSFLACDPLTISDVDLLAKTRQQVNISAELQRDDCLQLLLSHCIEPRLSKDDLIFISHYPASQAALAQLDPSDHRVALRFECYLGGIELANGFQELTDAALQRKRFLADNQQRAAQQKAELPLDEYLLAALHSGLPSCSGVALGLDRLLMHIVQATTLDEVIAFPWDRA